MAHSHFLKHKKEVHAVAASFLVLASLLVGDLQTRNTTEAKALVAQDTKAVTADEQKNRSNHIKDQQNYSKNLRRELSDIVREAKTLDTSAALGHMDQFDQCIQARAAEIPTESFWTNIQDCYTHTKEVEIMLQENLRPKRDCANVKRNIEDRKREKKNNVERGIKDILRNDPNTDVSALNNLAKKMDEAFAKVDAVTVESCTIDNKGVLDDASRDLDGYFRDYYDFSNDLNQKSNDSRTLAEGRKDVDKNIKRGCERDKAREMKNFDKDVTKAQKAGTLSVEQQQAVDSVKALYQEICVNALGAMEAALQAQDVDALNDALNNFWNLDRDFWDTLNETRNSVNDVQQEAEEVKRKEIDVKQVTRDLNYKEKEVGRMRKQLKRVKTGYDRAVKKYADSSEKKELLQHMANLIGQGEGIRTKIESLISDARTTSLEDPQDYWYGVQQDLSDLQNDFFEYQQTVEVIGSIFNDMKNADRELKRKQKDIGRGFDDPDLQAEMSRIADESAALLKQVWTDLIVDPEAARDSLDSYWELSREWDDTLQNFKDREFE